MIPEHIYPLNRLTFGRVEYPRLLTLECHNPTYRPWTRPLARVDYYKILVQMGGVFDLIKGVTIYAPHGLLPSRESREQSEACH